MSTGAVSSLVSTLSFAFVALAPAHAQCDGWRSGFGLRGGEYVVSQVHGFLDASGPSLFVGGSLGAVDGTIVSAGARWDGTSWSSLPGATNESASSFATFDDGSGRAVYATLRIGSAFRVARWTAAGWTNIAANIATSTGGTGLLHGTLDDGSGPALYLGGGFTTVHGISAPKLARWNGTTWQGFGSGPSAVGHPFLYDDGSGLALHVAMAAGTGYAARTRFERWNGTSWTSSFPDVSGLVQDVEVFDDGSGPALYVCGYLNTSTPGITYAVARLAGSAWAPLIGPHTWAVALRAHDFGAGPVLCTGITDQGNQSTHLFTWNGTTWTPLGGELAGGPSVPQVSSMTSIDLGAGPELVLGGAFDSAGGVGCFDLARWTGGVWSAFGTQDGVPGNVNALVVHDDGSGPALYAAGAFHTAGGVAAPCVARWRASTSDWSAVGASSFALAEVRALASFDAGSGPALYAAATGSVRRWNGSAWSVVSGGGNVGVEAFATADLGSGPRLFAAGMFSSIGGIAAAQVASFDGAAWSPLGAGVPGAHTIAAHDDGAGVTLYVADATHVYRWDGTTWSQIGGLFGGTIRVLAALDDGTGEALYAGGQFHDLPSTTIARWRNGAWSALGNGVGTSLSHHVDAIAVHDDGNGLALYAGGLFEGIPGSTVTARRVAKWNGAVWTGLGAGIERGPFSGETVRALATFADAASGAPALFAGGDFARAGGVPSHGFAEWVACFPAPSTFCAGDGTGTPCPCANGTAGRGCRHSVLPAGALLTATGTGRISADQFTLHLTGATNQLAVFLQGTDPDSGGLGTQVFDGVRCVDGTLVRLATKLAVAGVATYPEAGELPISVRGHVPMNGGSRYYQVMFRDPLAIWCPPETANWSNGVTVNWVP